MCQRCMRTTTHGGGHIGTSDTLNRRVEVVEALGLDDLRTYLTTDTERRETTLCDDKAVTACLVTYGARVRRTARTGSSS